MNDKLEISPPPQHLTEDEIKRAFVPFLRNFYKDRYVVVSGTFESSLDNVSGEGYVADGKITFLKKDDPDAERREFFTCTFEATSRDKADEVRYLPNERYLRWDANAFAAVMTAGFYVLSFYLRTQFLYSLGVVGNLGLVLAAGGMFFSLWYFAMRGWKKYRYIYAVEQFKRYFAEEQWIALADDVFPNPQNPFLVELKNQCVFNGFGLAIVAADGSVRTIATPSRLGIYGKDRKMVEWITETKPFKNLQKTVGAVRQVGQKIPDPVTVQLNKIWRWLDYYFFQKMKSGSASSGVGRQISGNTSWIGEQIDFYKKYMDIRWTQLFMAALGAFALVFFLSKTFSHKEIDFIDEEQYSEFQRRRLGLPNPEERSGYVAEPDLPRYGSIPKQYPDNVEAEDDGVQEIDLSGDGDDEEIGDQYETETPQPRARNERPTAAEKPAVRRSPSTSTDACAAVRGKKGWLIQDSYYSEKVFATERLEQLRHRGLRCFAVPRSCLDKNGTGWFVFIGAPYPSETAARTDIANFKKALVRYDLDLDKPLILRKLR